MHTSLFIVLNYPTQKITSIHPSVRPSVRCTCRHRNARAGTRPELLPFTITLRPSIDLDVSAADLESASARFS